MELSNSSTIYKKVINIRIKSKGVYLYLVISARLGCAKEKLAEDRIYKYNYFSKLLF